jgi:ZIP family zinc transporter
MEDYLFPIFLSFVAGSASGIGGLVVYIFGKIDESIMGFIMGFAGGVMLIVSLLELFTEALSLLSHLDATFAFAIGAIIMMVIDLTLPHMEAGRWETGVMNPGLLKTGIIVAFGISLHNLPEGIVILTSYSHLPKLGLMIALMICLHNIPEGIATATPLVLAGLSKRRALLISFLSGMTEPLGALIGSMFLMGLGRSDYIIGLGLAIAAGIMTYITVDELIPMAHEYSSNSSKHIISTGILSGMLFGHIISVFLKIG